MRKADYSKIAPVFDKGRPLLEQNLDLWLGIISKYAKSLKGARLLDLGCGTGRFTIPIATKLYYQVTGADSSKEMLSKAREKDTAGLAKWDLMDAHDLTYPDNSFDIVFMSFLLHHCDDPERVIHGCWRVLDKGGVILLRHADMEQVQNDVEHTFFPETLVIEKARIYSIEKIENCLKDTGFTRVKSEKIIQFSFTTGKARLEAIKLKNTSSLTIISQDAFERGVRRLEEYLVGHPDDPWLLQDKMTMTVGYKDKTG